MNKSIAILENLVGFATISRDSNLAMIEWIESYLGECGVKYWRISSDDGTKANILARIGPDVEGGVVLSGHTDVVPVTGQNWSTNPFTLSESDDGRLFGRGTCDMKGFLACVLAQVPKWNELKLKKPIYLAFSYDEEVGCLGAPRLIERLMADHPRPSAVIVGEPTLMRPVVAHKGATNLRTTVIGCAAHSSQIDQGVSAIHVAARLVTKIEDIMEDLKAEGCIDEAFNVSHSSLHVGKISGGGAINIMARECVFDWEIRHLPQDDVGMLLGRVEAYAKEFNELSRYQDAGVSITTELLTQTVPALVDAGNDEALSLCQSLLGSATPYFVNYVTEAGQFQRAGLPTVICGPGSIMQAHQPDEFISVDQMLLADSFLSGLGFELSML